MSASEFFKQLQAAFRDVDHEHRLRQQLASLKQTTSVQAYISAFRGLLVELGDEAPNSNDQLYTFIAGLKPAVQLQVRLQHPKLLSEAEELADTADSALYYTQHHIQQPSNKSNKKYGKGVAQQYKKTYPQAYTGPMPMDIDYL